VECTVSGEFKVAMSDGTLAGVACVPTGGSSVEVRITRATTTFEVTQADKEKMCADMPGVATAFQTTLCEQPALVDACPVVTAQSDDCGSDRRARRLSETVLFDVDFEIEVTSMTAEDAASLTTVLTDLSTNAAFQDSLQASIESSMDVTVLSMVVAPPETVVEYEVKDPTSAGGDSGSDDGGMNPAIIVVVLLLVVCVIGGVYKAKSGGGN